MISKRTSAIVTVVLTACAVVAFVARGRADTWPQLSLTPQFTFDQPVHATGAGDGSGRLFVVELTGKIKIVKNGAVLPTPFIDLTDRLDCGDGRKRLLSVAFPPGYAAGGHFYVKYLDKSCNVVVSRFFVSGNPDVANPASEQIVLSEFVGQGLFGGPLYFGPDGFLYVSLGDGSLNDAEVNTNAQDLSSIFGKLLRLDTETGSPATYTIPPANPFVGVAGARAEIWAKGLRNPWRFAFDRANGDLYIGDVGSHTIEEVDVQPAASLGGENYGWKTMEGNQCFNGGTCDQTGLTLPAVQYDHTGGACSVTGGSVYRGAEFPSLQGIYVYGDFCTGTIYGLRKNGAAWETSTLGTSTLQIVSFGDDDAGNLYLMDYAAGGLYKVQVGAPTPPLPSIVSFTATPQSLVAGQSTRLDWTTSGATSVTLDNVTVVNSSHATVTPSVTTTYTLKATNDGGDSTATVTIPVYPSLPTAVAEFVASDSTTQGTWIGAYGAHGYSIPLSAEALPVYAQLNPSPTASPFSWVGSTDDVRALTRPGLAPDRRASTWFSPTSFDLDLTLTDGHVRNVSLYLLDFTSDSRSQTMQVLDGETSAVLDTQTASGFAGGQYWTWRVRGHVIFRITNTNPATNAVVAGMFFDAAPNHPPNVSITSPAAGASFGEPATIPIVVSADDLDGQVSEVRFYGDGVLLATVPGGGPYQFSWIGEEGAGPRILTAQATDELGAIGTSAPVSVNVTGNSHPTVSMTGPAPNAAFSAPAAITLSANAQDVDGTIAAVDFYAGLTLVASSSSTGNPYTASWTNVPVGTYVLTAHARDNSGSTTTSAPITIHVNPNVAPTISMTSPANGSFFFSPATIQLAADAADSDGPISQVQFSVNGAPLASAAIVSGHASYTWTNVQPGSYALTAAVTDVSGATTVSQPVNVTAAFNVPATVSLTEPADTAIFQIGSPISISATAQDSDGAVTEVRLYAGAALLATFAGPGPHTFSWTNAPAGVHVLTAQATDSYGAITTSASATIRVNLPPTVSLTSPVPDDNFVAPATINLVASASDPDDSVYEVRFFNGAQQIGLATTPDPFTATWSNVPDGVYQLTLRAADTAGGITISAPVTIIVGNKGPVVHLTSPTAGPAVAAPASIALAADAHDPDGTIAQLRFYSGERALGPAEITSAPYELTLSNQPSGTYVFAARASDNVGNLTVSSPVSVTVAAPSSGVNAAATFVTTDSLTQGSWKNVYGHDGAVIATDTGSAAPGYAQVTIPTDGVAFAWNAFNLEPRALQRVDFPDWRVAASWYANPGFAIDVNLTDGLPHQVALYVLDYDGLARNETVAVIDAVTGAVLDSRSIAGFSQGKYLVWTITGHVAFRFTKNGDSNVVVSGLFFEPSTVAGNTPPTVTLNSPTGGPWTAPATVGLSASASDNEGTVTVKFYDGATLIGQSLDSVSPFTFTWTNVGAGTHTVTARATDNNNATTTSNSATVTVAAPPPATPTASFVALDTTTQGTWITHYGADGAALANFSTNYPAYAQVAFSGEASFTWADPTSVVRALQKPIGTDRVASLWYAPGTFTIDVNITDFALHHVALYALDWNNQGFSQRIDVVNATTQAVLATQTVSAFSGGKYLDWQVGGHVQFKVTNLGGPNSAISGLFFGTPSVAPPNTAPTVTLGAPTGGPWTDPATVGLSATASDSDGTISTVKFYDGATLIGTSADISSPYTFTWTNVAAGTHTVTAQATDNSAATTTSNAVQVTVAPNGPVNQPPTVTLANPTGGPWTPPADVLLSATANDSDGTISTVSFYDGATLIGTSADSANPYTLTWSGVLTGSHSVTARATDNLGATTTSQAITVTIGAAPTLPTVQITSPVSGGPAFPAPAAITLTAEAQDPDGVVTSVTFFLSETQQGPSIATAPYTMTMDSKPAGTYVLSALVTDDSGNQATSLPVFTTVAAPATGVAAAASFLDTDAATQGAWKTLYGHDGYQVITDTTSLPAYAQVTAISNQAFAWSAYNHESRGLERVDLPTYRVGAAWYSNPGFAVDVNLTDGLSHRVALYLVDWDRLERNETVTVVNAVTGAILDTRNVSDFGEGKYLSWDITGHVAFVFIRNNPAGNAVVSGIFFDVPSGTAGNNAPTVTLGSATGGPWTAPATVGLSATAFDTDGTISSVKFYDGATLIGTSADTTNPYTFNWTNVGGGTHTVTAKATDNLATTTTSAPLTVTVALPAGSGPSATYVTTDATTHGSWIAHYGGDGSALAGFSTSYPAYAQVSRSGEASFIWAASTNLVQALQKPGPVADRIASTWYAGAPFTIDVNITDGLTHQVALYGLDWEAGGRSQRIDVLNATTQAVLDTRTVSGFAGGQYWIYQVGGHVTFRMTPLTGPNAAVAALFFDPAGGTTPNVAPTVTLGAATGGPWTEPATVGLSATASDSDGTIATVKFYDGATLVGTSVNTTSPYTFSWTNVAAGTHTVTAQATDNGALTTTSNTVTVTVAAGVVNPAPTVTLNAPTGGPWTAPATVGLSATASDDGSVASLKFYDGATLITTINGAGPYSYSWTGVAAGTHSVTAVATDNLGKTGTSAAQSVTVALPAGSGPVATYVKTDTTTQGTWKTVYGTDGATLANFTPSNPGYAQVALSGEASYTWNGSTPLIQALQKPGGTDRAATTWYSGGSFTIDVNITDGQVHQVALYGLDWDPLGRSQRIDVLNATTQAVLDTRTVSGFSGGQYWIWQAGGHVTFRVTNLGAGNAVISGIFFDPANGATPNVAPTVTLGAATGGPWTEPATVGLSATASDSDGTISTVKFYDGATLIGTSVNTTSPYTFSWTNVAAGTHTVTAQATDNGALTTTSNTVTVTVAAGVVNPAPTATLNAPTGGPWTAPATVGLSATASDDGSVASLKFYDGATLITTINGAGPYSYSWTGVAAGTHSVTAVATDNLGKTGTSAAQSVTVALPAGSGPSATYVKTDTTTQGTWKTVYGTDAATVVNASTSYPSYAQVTPAGNAAWTWNGSTTQVQALQKPGGNDRIAAVWYAGTSFTIDVNITDGQVHQIALYGLDYPLEGRSQRIDVRNATTQAVLDTRTVSGFAGGQYWVYQVSGHVTFVLTWLTGPNAVVSGIFFDPATGATPNVAPTVTLGAATGGPWTEPATVGLSATASDSDGTIATVKFYDGATLIGTSADTTSPYTFSWTNVAAGTHTVTAQATDNGALTTTSNTVTVTVAAGVVNPAPTATLNAPTGGPWTAPATVGLSATASDDGSVASLKFYDGATLITTINGAGPYSYSWTGVAAGTHSVTAVATDNLGKTGTSAAQSVTVALPAGAGPSALYVATDTTHQGTWKTVYGTDAATVVNASTTFPSYAQVTVTGNAAWTWNGSTTQVQALQKPGGVDRIAAVWYAATSFTIDVNITDGQLHQIALYGLDYPLEGRSQRIDVLNATTQAVLDTRTVSGFGGGQYWIWQIGGHVTFRLTNITGPNAGVSGIFFDPAGGGPSNTAPTVTLGAATGGPWTEPATVGLSATASDSDGTISTVKFYDGATLIGTSVNTTSPYTFSWTNVAAGTHTVTAQATDNGALTTTSNTVTVTVAAGVVNPAPTATLNAPTGGPWTAPATVGLSATASDDGSVASLKFYDGATLITTINGAGPYSYSWTGVAAGTHSVTAVATDNLGKTGTSAAQSVTVALPAGSGPSASYSGTDSATQGSWKTHYGQDAATVVNATTSYPSYAQVTPAGNAAWTWNGSTTQTQALQKPGGSDRIAATWYSASGFTVDVNITDGLVHTIALYGLDYDSAGRSQRIDVLDATTQAVLNTQTVSGFAGGQYWIWQVSGHVTFKFTTLSGTNAVVSGLFFGVPQ